jgi:outer membrane protein OmpA-like peptidoglycan-associated protein
VEFATGSPKLGVNARESLSRFAGIVGVYPSMKILVEGHTDSTGSYRTNQEPSYARADSVRDYLVSQGVPEANLQVTGRGPDVPVASNDTAEGRARNRRVELILSGDLVTPRR